MRAARRLEEALEAALRAPLAGAHRAAYLVVHDAAAAEDIAQEAFLAAVRALDRFDRRRPFGPWLHRIVVNRAIDWARARSLRQEVAVEPRRWRAGSHDRAPRQRSRPCSESVVAALASLSPEHRAVVVLRYLLEYTPGEIAEALELPRGTVNSRLRRALDRLAESWREGRERRAAPGAAARRAAPEAREAEERGWRVVHAAFEGRHPVHVRRRASTGWRSRSRWPAGRRRCAEPRRRQGGRPGPRRGRARVGERPTGARLRAGAGASAGHSAEGPWIVDQDGSQRLLGAYEEAAWSPTGCSSPSPGAASSPPSTRWERCAGRWPRRGR